MPNNTFKLLRIENWKQFDTLQIEFHPKLTVLTGANGSGKTTVLSLLSKHFGWSFVELATPARDKETGLFRFFQRFFKIPDKLNEPSIGELQYTNGEVSNLTIPQEDAAQYHITINNQQAVRGISIPSHRPVYSYRKVSQIQTTKRTKTEAFSLVFESSQRHINSGGGNPSSYFLKETLLNWALGGRGNEFIEEDPELRQYFLGFQEVLTNVLPKTLGFREITIRNYEIILLTDSGDFMLDAVSGGISAIIDLAWHIYTYSNKNDEHLVILIDEVENHLHATMQRSILPSFLKAFPNVQFIVSTHSPLIVGSVKDSNVYVFRYNENNRVYNEKLDLVNKAKTATEVLNEVLGVPFTMPLWVEDQLNDIVAKYSKEEITEDVFDHMRNDLKEIGLEELMPEAIKHTLRKI